MRFFWISRATAAVALCALAADDYDFGPDSARHDGVPRGALIQHDWASKVFPGTTRRYWVYVPVQLDKTRPAPVMVLGDGDYIIADDGAMRAVAVLDNLIYRKEIPPMIGIFIQPGTLPAVSEGRATRFNRSYEFDSLSSRYPRLILEEIVPQVRREYNLSTNPDDWGISGHRSSAIAAFTAAWSRPDRFHRVISFVGSFARLRSGDTYPALIRKMEPKPLRIFMQDGRNDQSIYAGAWFLANQQMASAFEYAGYDYKFLIGEGTHNVRHGATILPDALRWLWRGYPAPIRINSAAGTTQMVRKIVDPLEPWLDAGSSAMPVRPAKLRQFAGRVLPGDHTIRPRAIALSVDGDYLLAAEAAASLIWSFQIQRDGRPAFGEPFYHLESSDETSQDGAISLATDRDGNVYASTALGIQVCDTQGRTIAILNQPPGGPATELALDESSGDTIYARVAGSVYRRKLLGPPPVH